MNIASIGFGNMASAIFYGLKNYKDCSLSCTIHTKALASEYQNFVQAYELKNIKLMLERNNYILLAIKPNIAIQVLQSIVPYLTKKHCIISVVAGLSLHDILTSIDNSCPVIRAMPNLPVKILQGTTALSFDDPCLSAEQKKVSQEIFNYLGKSIIIPESRFSAFTALIGCSPAYILQIIDAFVKAGISLGFSAKESKDLLISNLLGTASLAKSSDKHLTELIEEICSPAGLTIKGINYMHRQAIPGLLTETIMQAYNMPKKPD